MHHVIVRPGRYRHDSLREGRGKMDSALRGEDGRWEMAGALGSSLFPLRSPLFALRSTLSEEEMGGGRWKMAGALGSSLFPLRSPLSPLRSSLSPLRSSLFALRSSLFALPSP